MLDFRGALAAGLEKEGELETTSLEFEYLHRKSQCKMLIGGDDISNDVITLGTCFSMFGYFRNRFRFALIGGNLTAQWTGSHRGNGLLSPPIHQAFSQLYIVKAILHAAIRRDVFQCNTLLRQCCHDIVSNYDNSFPTLLP